MAAPSPPIATAMTAGMMARSRVAVLLTTGEMWKVVKPSMTIWPGSVLVRVAFCADASRATANSVEPAVFPRTGERST